MADLGLQLEPISQGLEQHGPWHFRDVRFQQDRGVELEAALLQTATIPGLGGRLLEISKAGRTDCHGLTRSEVTLSVPKVSGPLTTTAGRSGPGPPGTPASATNAEPGRPLFPTRLHPTLVFTQIPPSGEDVVVFPLPAPHPRAQPCFKRRRPETDVDGPNSSPLGCKKRRLLRHLITSRLSQPFSLPATHILNREAAAAGNKRFLKLAAIMSARRLNNAVVATQSHAGTPAPPQQPSPSTWLRRAAMLNSLRHRVCVEATEQAASSNGSPPVADPATRAAVFQQGHGTTAFVSGRYLSSSSLPRPAIAAGAATTPGLRVPGAQPPSQGQPSPSQPPLHASSVQSAIAITTGTPTAPTTCLLIPGPKLRPLRSPELRVTRPLVPLEDVEDLDKGGGDGEGESDGVAFPTSEHESRYEDEPEEVYADFSVIFGGGGGEGEGGIGDEEDEAAGFGGAGGDHFEDYMDDLDGIPWVARC